LATTVNLTRQTLLPTARTLPNGVPASMGLNRHLPSTGHGHDDHGVSARSDLPSAWSGTQTGYASVTRVTPFPTTKLFYRALHTTSLRSASDGALHNLSGGLNQQASPESRSPSTGVPDFSHYKAQNSDRNRTLSYFMVGSLGVLAASGAKSTVTDLLSGMAASADVLALAKIEVEMGAIPEGKNLIVKWRGKPMFIRHRTPDEIEEANAVDLKTLRDPQTDEERTKRPEWLVMLGVCTHLGCVPIGEAGDYGGWFCPCHGSHYDISGRVRRGPAPLNLAVPEYDFNDEEEKIIVG